MATLNSKIEITSSDFFSQKLSLSTSSTSSTHGDDRAFSVERVEAGVRPSSTLTVVETVLSNLNNKTLILTDPYNNVHKMTFSTTYASSTIGKGSEGQITVTSTNLETWNGKTLIMIDNYSTARTLTITFNNTTTTVVRGTCTTTAIAYAIGLSGLTTIEAIRNKISEAVETIRAAGDISINAAKDNSNVAIVKFNQEIVGSTGNTSITGTSSGATTTNVNFVKGGLGYTDSFIGIADNEAAALSHAQSLWSTLHKARENGKIMIHEGPKPDATTGAVLTVSVIGPYEDLTIEKPTGTAVTASEMTVTAFSGGDVPQEFPCGEFNSAHKKVYVYMVNKNKNVGTANIYIKDSTQKSRGVITSSQADTSGIAAGKTIILESAKGLTYTLTSVASDSDLAAERVSDLAYKYREADTMEETMANIIETLELVDNKAGREKKPFKGSLDSNLSMKIQAVDAEAGIANNTAISGTFEGEGIITATDFTGSVDKYHLISRLEPGEFMFIPLSGSSKLYTDAEDAVVEVEYLTLEK